MKGKKQPYKQTRTPKAYQCSENSLYKGHGRGEGHGGRRVTSLWAGERVCVKKGFTSK